MRARRWIQDLERTFEVCGCIEAHMVLYGSYMLQGEAANWWETKRPLLEMVLGSLAAVSWQRFKKEFDDRYFPVSVRRQKAREFNNLVQGDMTVEQYGRKFMALGRFAPHLIATEELRQVAYLQIMEFQKLVDLANIAERENNFAVGSPLGQKRRSYEAGLQCALDAVEPMRAIEVKGEFSVIDVASRVTLLESVPVEFKEVKEDEEVDEVEGAARDSRVRQYDFCACTLFDSGASQSFVSATFAQMCNLVTEPLSQSLLVTFPNGEMVWCFKVALGCPLDFGGRTLDTDLIVFKLLGFDIILGMDWLYRYSANIDCRSRVQVVSTPSEKKSLADIPVVEEFPDVFVDELPGLPPVRDVEFFIDLEPGAAPMHKAPYRMAPAELKELKTQLQ
ncbi:uncharacterized protein LOC118348692 [Juglans regia]|uniref:Uncharacterized protein LOC118348692 n=1 Tax=Juglans regia TaxID=51240 RepID=A0A6P9EGU3_JUGRE|nr:uncharacterized protein LOC118348692 [Juglans regia]